jgi:hypothetical protein
VDFQPGDGGEGLVEHALDEGFAVAGSWLVVIGIAHGSPPHPPHRLQGRSLSNKPVPPGNVSNVRSASWYHLYHLYHLTTCTTCTPERVNRRSLPQAALRPPDARLSFNTGLFRHAQEYYEVLGLKLNINPR